MTIGVSRHHFNQMNRRASYHHTKEIPVDSEDFIYSDQFQQEVSLNYSTIHIPVEIYEGGMYYFHVLFSAPKLLFPCVIPSHIALISMCYSQPHIAIISMCYSQPHIALISMCYSQPHSSYFHVLFPAPHSSYFHVIFPAPHSSYFHVLFPAP